MKVFKEGGSLPLKIPMSSTKFVQTEIKNKSKEVKFQESFRMSQRKREMYALWVECLYRLSLANHVSALVLSREPSSLRDEEKMNIFRSSSGTARSGYPII